jgi:hypothetical protein
VGHLANSIRVACCKFALKCYAFSTVDSVLAKDRRPSSIKPQLRLVGNRSPSHKAIRERPLLLPFFCYFSFYSCMGSFDAFSQE